jgi:histone acetyltransferase (RNA polymerase elongator complex component)
VVKTTHTEKHFTIPVFIPGVGCPFQCIFCDQKKITGEAGLPTLAEVEEIIHRHLETIPAANTFIEIGFFGGTFTGLPEEKQSQYLEVVQPFLESGRIRGIRLSTRPDFITLQILTLLKEHHVTTIELGAQSMDDEVLKMSERGHLSSDTEKSSRMILEAGFTLGLQMMVGLPGDTEERSLSTARKIISSGATETRIYPALVIAGTEFEKLLREGKYLPLNLEEAVRWTKNIVVLFELADVKILRIGLHPSEELVSRSALVAGPFHPSFRELVMTEIWNDRFRSAEFSPMHHILKIRVNPSDINNAIGYSGKNRNMLMEHYREVKFTADPGVHENCFHADYR